MEGVAAYSSPRPLASAPRAGNLPLAVLVALGALFVAAAAVLVVVAFVALVAGHRGVELGRQPLLMAAGFSCAYAASVVGVWRGGRLHPAAVFAVWALGLCVAVPGAAVPGAAVACLGGAVAVALGSSRPLWRDRRLIVGLALGALVLSAAAAALSPAGHVHVSASPVTPAPVSAPAATAIPAATPAPVSRAATPAHVSPAATTPTNVSPAAATPARVSPATSSGVSPAATPAASPIPVSPAVATPTTPTHASPSAATPGASPASPSGGAVAPLPPVAPGIAAAATSIVRDFYAALDARRFAAAWAMLPRALQTRFGGFAHWRAGYRTTLASRPGRLAVTATAGGGLLVRHVLVATDHRRCGTDTRRYAVTWRLERSRASWGVVSLAASALGPATASCR